MHENYKCALEGYLDQIFIALTDHIMLPNKMFETKI